MDGAKQVDKVNTSGLKPLGRAVIVKTYELKQGVIMIPDAIREKGVVAEQRAVIVAIGPDAWREWSERPRIGDKVIFTKFAGFFAMGPGDGQPYRVVNDRDIFLGITYEMKEE
jgi:co-chaperonin GroES (HSP10)